MTVDRSSILDGVWDGVIAGVGGIGSNRGELKLTNGSLKK